MNNSYRSPKNPVVFLNGRFGISRTAALIAAALIAIAVIAAGGVFSAAAKQKADVYKNGERLTYTISFNNYDSAAFAEVRVVSKGRLEGKEAVELFGKLRSVDLLSAAFYLWDETRTTYVSPESGYPLYIKSTSNAGVLPVETVSNYLGQTSSQLDLLSLVYKARQSRGVGSFSVQESGAVYSFDFAPSGTETVDTEAGRFETGISTVTSQYLTDLGIGEFRINFSADDRALPVLVRFRAARGEFVAKLASIQDLTPAEQATPKTETPSPTPIPTPTPEPTPKPYIDNQPLSPDLPFDLGETLRYKVTKNGEPVADIGLSAKERKLNQGDDSLLLSAFVYSLGPANDLFGSGDQISSWVDPDTLAPFSYSIRFSAGLSAFTQSAVFNQADGTVSVPDGELVQVPVGTHSLISLAYAVRAFNLRANPDPNSPVNDTRVAIFLGNAPVVLTLRPSGIETTEIAGVKRTAQMVSVRAGIPEVDQLNIRFWLSADGRRIPLRVSAGDYQADLISIKTERPAKDEAVQASGNARNK